MTLTIHPAIDRLRGERALLRQEFARAVAAARDLELVVRPYVLALFQTRLGAAELARLVADHRYRRARRALELIQAQLNRGRAPDLAALDAQLDVELAAYWAEVAQHAAALDQARAALQVAVTPVDGAEVRRLYMQLVLALHPDLHPDQSQDDADRWHRLQRAYADGDLEMLRALAAFVTVEPDEEGTVESLEREVTELRRRVRELEASTAAVESTSPYNLRALLEDEAWVTGRREALATETAALEQKAAALEEQADRLVEGVPRGGPAPRPN